LSNSFRNFSFSLQAKYIAKNISVGILDIRKTGMTVASIEIILGFSDCEVIALSVITTPSTVLVNEVIPVFVYIDKERMVIIENIKQIKGIINPNHLFFVLERNICSQTLPARSSNKTIIKITVFSIYLPSFWVFLYSLIKIFAVSKSTFSFTARRLISAIYGSFAVSSLI
jgi:hypothetical protein